MTPILYKQARKLRGTQTVVAAALGIHYVSLARRETGVARITHEHWLALLSLPKKKADKTAKEYKPSARFARTA